MAEGNHGTPGAAEEGREGRALGHPTLSRPSCAAGPKGFCGPSTSPAAWRSSGASGGRQRGGAAARGRHRRARLAGAGSNSSSPRQRYSPKGVLSLQFDLVQVQRPRFGQLGRDDVETLDTGQVERGELLSGGEVLK